MVTAAYYRNSISKEKQKLSIIMQKDHVYELAQNKKLLIDIEFSDESTSARKTKTDERMQMTRLLREIKKGNVKTLLVYSRCRLARNVNQYMEIYRTFKEHNIEVIFAAKHEFPMIYSIEGELIERIMAAFNQHEAENLVKKLMDAKLTKAREGLHAVGPVTFGYKVNSKVDGDWEIVEEEAVTIKKIYELFLSEEFDNFNQFVNIVNLQRFLFKGKKWSYANVRNLFKKPIYIGSREYQDKNEGKPLSVSVPHLKIVSKKVWDRVQIKLVTFIRETTEEVEEEPVTFLLKGLVHCFQCKQELATKKVKKSDMDILVYQCKKHTTVRYRKEIFEDEIINQANKFFNEILSTVFKEFLKNMVNKQA